MWPLTSTLTRRIHDLETLVDQQAQIIHQQATLLATLTGSPLPGPLRPPLRPLSPSSAPGALTSRAPRGAEAVSILDPKTRREREWVAEVSHPLPEYMKTQTAPDPDLLPPGTAVSGGFSPSPKPPPPPPTPPTPSEPR